MNKRIGISDLIIFVYCLSTEVVLACATKLKVRISISIQLPKKQNREDGGRLRTI